MIEKIFKNVVKENDQMNSSKRKRIIIEDVRKTKIKIEKDKNETKSKYLYYL